MGAESRQTAVRQCIKEMSERGIPAFVDAGGRQWSPEAYINMDVRTTCSNVAHEAQFTRMDDYNIDLLETSSHPGARPKCSLDQGKIFSKSGKNKKYPAWSTSSYGEPDGILGINCGHFIYPYIEGVSVQTYFPYDKEENDKLYKQKQEQRRLEREVRSAKREVSMLNVAGDKEGAKLAKERVKSRTAAYNDFCEKTGLPRKADRLTVQGYRAKAKEEKNDIAKISHSDIQYMSKSFRPNYTQSSPVSYSGKDNHNHYINVKKVSNSKYDMVTDITATRRDKAVRLTEKLVSAVEKQLPYKLDIPRIAIVDFESNGLNPNAIGGYDKKTDTLYINKKYNTLKKIKRFVSENNREFADNTIYAPITHELGHKYYEKCVTAIAKSKNMGYNDAKRLIDRQIDEFIAKNDLKDNLGSTLSEYAKKKYNQGKYTEVIAESFSSYNSNPIAKSIIDMLEANNL